MIKRSALGVSIAALLMAVPPGAHAAPGDLDPTFGDDGRVVTTVAAPGYTDLLPRTGSMLVQPDGKILVCGRFWGDDYAFGTFLVRYLPDGALDASFGGQGIVAVVSGGQPQVGVDMALQPDGKIVLIGEPAFAGGIIVQRYTSSGALDTTFGDDGTAEVPSEFPISMQGFSIALQPDGKVVGVGWEIDVFSEIYYDAIVVFRMNRDGSMDEGFGSAGTGVATITHGYDGGKVLIQPDGRILVVGRLANYDAGIPFTAVLARYNRDGTLDSSFGNLGMVTYRLDGRDSSFSGAALQPDGKIVVIGRTYNSSPSLSFVVRYDVDGAPDTSFGTNGVFSATSSLLGSAVSVAVHNRSIVVIGNAFDATSGGNGFAVVRLTPGGELDPSFGVGGRSLVSVPGSGVTPFASASDGTVRHDGRILVGGYFSGDAAIALVRLHAGLRSNPIRFHENTEREGNAFRLAAPEPCCR